MKTRDVIEWIEGQFREGKRRVTVKPPKGVTPDQYRKRLYGAMRRRGHRWRFALDVFMMQVHVIK